MRYKVLCIKNSICTVLYESFDIQEARIHMFTEFYNELHKRYHRPFYQMNKRNKDLYMMSLNSCCIANDITLCVADTEFWYKFS